MHIIFLTKLNEWRYRLEVAIIKPFRALRPIVEKAKDVSCVPYDVIYKHEARRSIKKNPDSFLRITRPEAEFENEAVATTSEIFEQAKGNLERFINEKLLFQENEPCIYVYKLATNNHIQMGVVACCAIGEYENGIIKKHEKTRPNKVKERTEHMLALKAQTGLVFLAFRNTETIRKLIKAAVSKEPLYNFSCSDDVRQTIWKIAQTDEWVDAFEKVPSLYIADGHHRVKSSKLTREKLREENPNHTGNEEYNFFIAGMYPSEDLNILAYNRVVKDLNGLSESEFLQKVSKNYKVSETKKKMPEKQGEFCMYMDGKWRTLEFNHASEVGQNPIKRLDVSILSNYLLSPFLGIGDERTDKRISFVGGARGTKELERIINEGMAKLAFSVFPTTMNDLFAVSDMGEVMPPKSTWFEPKLKDGLFVYLI